MSLPANPTTALAAFVFRRAQLSWRGLSFDRKPAESVSERMRLKMDVCWTIAIGLAMIDPIRAGAFQSMHMLLALESGDVRRVARALAVEVPFSATPGPRNHARTAMLTARAEALASEVGDPHVDGLLAGSVGGAAWLEGDWTNGLTMSVRGDEMVRTQCTGMAWNLDTTTIVRFDCLYRLGRWNEVIDAVPEVLADARARGDLYMEVYSIIKLGTLARIAADQPELAADELAQAITRWSKERFTLLHYWEVYGQCEAALYRRKPVDAEKRLHDGTKGVKSSLLLQLQLYRVSWVDLRGRVALASASSRALRFGALRAVDAAVRELQGEDVAWSRALGALLRAGALATRTDREGSARALREAARELSAVGMELHAAVALARLAEITGDIAGIEAAHADIASRGIANPARIVEVMAPGLYAALAK